MLKSIFSTLLTSGLCVTMLATASYGESAKLPSIGTHAFDGYCSVGEPFAKTVQVGGDTYELSGTTWTRGRETYFACPVLKIQGSADVAKALYFDDTSTTGRNRNDVVDAFCDLLKPGTNAFFWEFGLARGSEVGQVMELDAADNPVGMAEIEASQLPYFDANQGFVKIMKLMCKRGI